MEEIIKLYKVFILDFDGTLWNGHQNIPGVAEVVY